MAIGPKTNSHYSQRESKDSILTKPHFRDIIILVTGMGTEMIDRQLLSEVGKTEELIAAIPTQATIHMANGSIASITLKKTKQNKKTKHSLTQPAVTWMLTT